MKKVQIEIKEVYRDYLYIVLFNLGGYRCGYVSIPKDSVLYNKDYLDEPLCDFEVHGGLTYARECWYFPIESNSYWIGFDCIHAGDGIDLERAYEYGLISLEQKQINMKYANLFKFEQVRNSDYVQNECKKLIDQIIEFEKNNKK